MIYPFLATYKGLFNFGGGGAGRFGTLGAEI